MAASDAVATVTKRRPAAGMALLATKLTVPRTAVRQVTRPRLFKLLNAGDG